MKKHAGLVCAIGAALIIVGSKNPIPLTAQGDPSSLPLLSSGSLEYVGGFRVPAETVNGLSFQYGGQAVAYDPSTDTLFVSSQNYVAEISIPTPVNSSSPTALPFGRLLQPFVDPTEGHLGDISAGDVKMDNLMVFGDRLHGTAYIYYDANNSQRGSHFSRSRQLNQPSFSGWSQVWEPGKSGYVGGMMAPVPSEWQAKLGAPAITGQCCLPIIWRTSLGPAAIGFNPAQVGQPMVAGTPLLYYPDNHATLGSWADSNPTYGSTTQILGVAVIANTRTVLYFGRNGMGQNCYGSGTADPALVGTTPPDGGEPYCYDPTNANKGTHAYPYRYQVWAYDLNDFAAVKAGSKQPWDVVPYGVWPLNLPTPERTVRLGGVGYDAVRQLLYVSQLGGDPDGLANRPLIHAFRVNATGVAVAPPTANPPTSIPPNTAPPNAVSAVTITPDKQAPQAPGTTITLTAQATGGVAPQQYKWIVTGGTATISGNWSTNNRLTWTPTSESANYRISVWVRSAGNVADSPEASHATSFPIAGGSDATIFSVSLLANRPAPQPIGNAIAFTATPSNTSSGQLYKWFLFNGSSWTTFGEWTASQNFSWYPSEPNGNYRIRVWVKAAASTAEQPDASAEQAYPITGIGEPVPTPTPTPGRVVTSVSLTANRPSPQEVGNAIGFLASPVGGTAPLSYKWFIFSGTSWTPVGDWTPSAEFSWYPSEANSNYRVRVWVKSSANALEQPEASSEIGFTITAP